MDEKNSILEVLAEVSHEIWAHWMQYLFSCTSTSTTGGITLQTEKAQRWLRQMGTPYKELSEEEKKSDRDQAQKIHQALLRAGYCIAEQEWLLSSLEEKEDES